MKAKSIFICLAAAAALVSCNKSVQPVLDIVWSFEQPVIEANPFSTAEFTAELTSVPEEFSVALDASEDIQASYEIDGNTVRITAAMGGRISFGKTAVDVRISNGSLSKSTSVLFKAGKTTDFSFVSTAQTVSAPSLEGEGVVAYVQWDNVMEAVDWTKGLKYKYTDGISRHTVTVRTYNTDRIVFDDISGLQELNIKEFK